MKKIFLFHLFTVILHSALLAQPSYMGEIIIQGNRISRPFSKPVQNISVITREQIAKSPARSIQEILTYVAFVEWC
jgi:outer membrane cobalamin receptor